MAYSHTPRPAPRAAFRRFSRRTWLSILAVLALIGTIGGAIFAAGTSTVVVELVTPGNIAENAGNASFRVRLSDPISDGQVQVTVRTVNGTGANGAVAGADFTLTEQVFTFTPADQGPRTFQVPVTDDALDELNETFDVILVDLTNTSSTTIFLGQPFTAVIEDNDSPTFTSVTGPAIVDEGAGVATFTVTMAQSSPQPVTLQWQLVGAGADPITLPPTAGADVAAAGGTWIIPANRPAGTSTFNIGIINDTTPEADEQFRLQITAVTNVANPAAALATDILVTILDNDGPPNVITNTGLTVAEGASGTIAQSNLQATDGQQGPTQLTFTVTTAPTNGTLFRNSVALAVNGTFTQQDIADNLITYTHNGSETTTDSFAFTVSDGFTPVGPETFNITITPANDAPVFDPDAYTATVAEDAAGGSAVTSVTATDPDTGDTLTYSITGGNTGTAFAIDGTTGAITVSDPSVLDFETTPSYTLTVTVTDAAGLTDTATVTITITNVNDAPVFDPDTYTATLAEDVAGGSAVVTVTATDLDTSDTLTYSITGGNTGTAFAIDGTTGAITVSNPSVLDFETTPLYTLTVTVTDAAGLTDTATVTITITNANDAPVFDPATYTATLAEDVAGGSAVTTVTATDPDTGDTLTYSITNGNTGTAFAIDGATGAITVSDPSVLDFETTPSYTLTVTVTDAAGLTDTATVTVTITNVNEAPVFAPDTYTATLAEDVAGGTAVTTVTATDLDAGDTLTYSITGGNTGTAFAINGATGAITVSTPSVLDFETTPSYTLTVTVTDAAGLTDTATVTVTITNANEAPVFNPDAYTATLAEDVAGGTAVTTVTATDPDTGDTLTYSITGGNTGTAFAINATTGAITVSDPSVLDFETTPSYTLTVTVTDAAGLTDTATVTITITNANDAPVFAPATYTATLAENAAGGAAVTTVTATDPDTGDTLTYSITGGNTGTAFAINGSTGAITVSDPSVLDFETTPLYTLTVTVTDAAGLTDTATVTVTITNVNEAPVFSPDTYTATLAEDVAGGTAVTTVTATDPDTGDTLTYSITSGNTGTAFAINATTGAITVSNPSVLDFETTPLYTLTVTVTDAAGLTDTATVTITITNANDAPVFDPATYTATLAEDVAGGAAVTTVTATDLDAGDTLTYSITNGNTGTAFAINGATGAITVSDPSVLDFETTPLYTLTVTVTDAAGLTDTATVTVTITNVNEAPVFAPDTYTATLAEDVAGGTAVTTVTATDPDAGNTLTYSITGGNTGTAFAINGATGAITVSTPSVLDFETTPSYTLTVTVTDAAGLTDTATVTVTITNVNDAPVATDDAYTVAEETTLNVGSPGVLANDTDVETPAALTVTAVNGTPFVTSTTVTTAEGGTLFIRANGSFDYTPATDFVGDDTFTYTVSDPGGATDTATVTITVTNVNDAPTIATNTGLTVAEGGEADITGTQLAAEDIDNTPAELSFLILTAPARGELRLNGTALSAGESFTQADINAGNLSYAHDGSETPLTDSFQFLVSDPDGDTAGPATFAITITAANDPPVVDANGAAAGIDYTVPTAYAEGQAAPLAVVDPGLTVTDADTTTLASVDVIIDDLRNGADESLDVDTTVATGIIASYSSGVLTLTGPADLADFEAVLRTLTYSNSSVDPGTSRTISIVATDSGSPAASSDPAAVITLTITPDFDAPTVTNNGLTLNEGTTANITPAQLSAADPDTAAADLVFTLTSVPANGELLRDGTALSVGGTFTQADIAAGLISYAHDGSQTTSDSFGFSLTDGDTTPITGTFAITIVPVNNAPVIVLTTGSTAYTPGDPAVVIDGGATVSDADSADFAGGELRVALSGNSAGDVLGIRNQGTSAGQIGVSGGNVTFGGTTIGTFTGGNGTPLVVTFNASATPAAAQALVRNITFVNTQATPAGGARTATFTISDGDGETSLPASKVITVELTTPNQSPIAANDSVSLPVNAGARVINVLANDSDPDGDTLIITAVTQPASGTVTISGGGTNVTYTAPQNFSGTTTFTYTISDGRGGTATATVTVIVTDAQVRLFLPLQASAPAPDQPDLTVTGIAVNPASPQAGAATEVRVTVRNDGTAAASNFWVDFYINPSRAPGVNDPWNELCVLDPCFGIAWFYTGTLAPGASVELISLPSTQSANGFVAASSVWPGYFANGTNKLYAVVDSWNRDTTGGVRDPNGAVLESNETNNRLERDVSVAQGTLPQARSFPAPMSLPER